MTEQPESRRWTGKVLIVEDSTTQAADLEHLLELEGFDVMTSENGNEALELLGRWKADVVISDILMPGMDGYELCRLIKSDAELKEMPVILLTYLSDPGDILKGLECGADNFITKPYEKKYLLSRIHNILLNVELRRNSKVNMGLEIFFKGQKYFITSPRQQILDLLLSTYETAVFKNHELEAALAELDRLNEQLEQMVEVRTAALKTEIGERKRAEEELIKTNDTLEEKVKERTKELALKKKEAEEAKTQAVEASRTKSDFLANMSHELRTPLSSILGFSEVLQDELFGSLNAKQKEYIDDIYRSGRHLLSLINDILDLSKVEAGKLELEISKFRLRDALSASLNLMKEKAMKQGIDMKIEVASGADIEVEADERKLKQILFNLLSNAVKFTAEGGCVSVAARLVPDPQLTLLSSEGRRIYSKLRTQTSPGDTDFVEISVTDTGIGIKAEDVNKLFKEFTQLESSCTKYHEGSGLGLALTKKLVELHRGKIWAESQYSRGSRFSFVIPVRTAAADSCKSLPSNETGSHQAGTR